MAIGFLEQEEFLRLLGGSVASGLDRLGGISHVNAVRMSESGRQIRMLGEDILIGLFTLLGGLIVDPMVVSESSCKILCFAISQTLQRSGRARRCEAVSFWPEELSTERALTL